MKEIAIGIVAALFFAFTFILNHSMELEGGAGYGAPHCAISLCYPFYSSL